MEEMIKKKINLQLFSDSGEKTEEATSKRKEDSRKKGQVAKSPDIAQIATLLAGMVILKSMGRYYHSITYSQFRNYFYKMDMTTFTPERMKEVMLSQAIIFFMLVMPILMTVLITGVIFNYLQVGFLFTLEPIKPSFDKINPTNGLKSMFSIKKLFELCKNIAKMTVIGFYGYKVLKANFLMLLKSPFNEFQAGFYTIINMCYGFIFNATIALFIIAIIDYFYQRWEYEKSLRMSKQEIKEEYKQTEGSPEVKGKLRAMRRELLKKKMIQNVPNATVVITNPTHISIALKYEDGMGAPRVIAKGEDKVAFKIREIAKEKNIPIIENKPLARAMYKMVDIEEEIPEEFYQAVAEILSYIFREKNM
jgi:flagellar biosynthetic protein FlhB